jgi:hypothetical protein
MRAARRRRQRAGELQAGTPGTNARPRAYLRACLDRGPWSVNRWSLRQAQGASYRISLKDRRHREDFYSGEQGSIVGNEWSAPLEADRVTVSN